MGISVKFGRLRAWFILLLLALPASTAFAQWELDGEKAAINFISIKNGAVAESHSFEVVSGSIGAAGAVQMAIDLDSVQTLIEIRNERMRELLFNTAMFPTADVTTQIDPAVLTAVTAGSSVSVDVPVTLSLHGMEKTLTASLVAIGTADGGMRVFTARPVLVSASQFGLDEGLAALQKIAGLNAISAAVPVTLDLTFKRVD